MPNWFAALPAGLPAALLDELRRGAPGDLHWFAPEDVHLTVAFFGPVREDRLEAVQSVLRSLPPPDLRATLGPLRALPDERRFSALAFELRDGAGEARAYLRAHHAALCLAAGVAPDPREPLPHLTIARPPRRSPRWRLRRILTWAAALAPPSVELHLDRLAVYARNEEGSARRFRVLFEVPSAREEA